MIFFLEKLCFEVCRPNETQNGTSVAFFRFLEKLMCGTFLIFLYEVTVAEGLKFTQIIFLGKSSSGVFRPENEAGMRFFRFHEFNFLHEVSSAQRHEIDLNNFTFF